MSGTKRSFSSALGGDENNSKRINMNSHAAVPAPALPVPASISAADPAVPPPASNGVYLDANGKGTAAAEASNGVAADGGAAAAVVEAPAEVPEAAEPVPNRLKPQDPTLQIREVTNNGDPANMEMLIHLKVQWLLLNRELCVCVRVALCACFDFVRYPDMRKMQTCTISRARPSREAVALFATICASLTK